MQFVFSVLPRQCLRCLQHISVPSTAAAHLALAGDLRSSMQAVCRGQGALAARPVYSCSCRPGRACPATPQIPAAAHLVTAAAQCHLRVTLVGASASRQATTAEVDDAASTSRQDTGLEEMLSSLSALCAAPHPVGAGNLSSLGHTTVDSSSNGRNSDTTTRSSTADENGDGHKTEASSRRRRRISQQGDERQHMVEATSNTAAEVPAVVASASSFLVPSSSAAEISIGLHGLPRPQAAALADSLARQQVDAQQSDNDPDQQQTQQAAKLLLLGIDPDTNGAFAVIAANLVPQKMAAHSGDSTDCSDNSCHGSSSSSSKSSSSTLSSKKAAKRQKRSISSSWTDVSDHHQQQQQRLLHVDLSSALVSVYDMPVESIPLRKPTKASTQRYRRRLDVARAVATIISILHQHQLLPGSNRSDSCSSSSSKPVVLRAVLEVSSIVPTNGSLSTLNQGFSLGAWTAALLALGFEVCTVHVRQWKKDLGLSTRDKDCSRQLAQDIFNAAGNSQDQLLSRKKDHGRAEALLIAAWGCGWSAVDLNSSSSSSRKQRGKAASKAMTVTRGSGDSKHEDGEGGANSSSSSSVRWSAHQGPLRDVVRMDGGMHIIIGTDAVEHLSSESDHDVGGWRCGATAAQPADAARQRANPNRSSGSKRRADRIREEATFEPEQQQ